MKQKYGHLSVLGRTGTNKFQQSMWLCRCDCGINKIVSLPHLREGMVKSCGCLRRPHGESRTPLHNVWCGMLKRCTLKSRHDYHRYGGRGIKVCRRWMKYENFRDDMKTAYLLHKKRHATTFLDRVDNDAGYSPKNCRWVTARQSARNRSTSKQNRL